MRILSFVLYELIKVIAYKTAGKKNFATWIKTITLPLFDLFEIHSFLKIFYKGKRAKKRENFPSE